MSDSDIEWLKLRFSWLTSERVQLMPSLSELALLRLILRCGKAGSIPASVDDCLMLVGKADMPREAVERAMAEFVPHPTTPGRLVHARTLRDRAEIFEKVERIRELRRASGKKGGEANGKQDRSKTEAKPKQTGSKTEANAEAKPKQTGSKTEANAEAKPKQTGSKTEANAEAKPKQNGSKTEANAEAKPKQNGSKAEANAHEYSVVECSVVECKNNNLNKQTNGAGEGEPVSADDAVCFLGEASLSLSLPEKDATLGVGTHGATEARETAKEREESATQSSRWRPKTHADAVRLCKAQMADAPEDFIHACFDRLEAVGWIDATGRNEVTHFGAYVRAAWRNQRQQDADRSAIAPVAIDEVLCEQVRDVWNEVAARRGMTRSRVAPGVMTKRAICTAFAGFKDGGKTGDEARAFKLGTFRILFGALGEDPACNGTRGKPVDLDYAVSPRGINYAAEKAAL